MSNKKRGGTTTGTLPPIGYWNHGKTATIRIPVALKEQILEYARQLDQENETEFYRSEQNPEVRTLSLIREFVAEIKRSNHLVPLMGWLMIKEFQKWLLNRNQKAA